MANPTTSTKNYGSSPAEPLKEAATHAGEKANEAASTFGSKAKEAASAVGDMVSNAASTAGSAVAKTADRATSAAGSGVKHLGETIKEKGPQEGIFGNATRGGRHPSGKRKVPGAGRLQRHDGRRHAADSPQPHARHPRGHRSWFPHRSHPAELIMATEVQNQSDPSVASLVSGIVHDFGDLVKQQLRVTRRRSNRTCVKARNPPSSWRWGEAVLHQHTCRLFDAGPSVALVGCSCRHRSFFPAALG